MKIKKLLYFTNTKYDMDTNSGIKYTYTIAVGQTRWFNKPVTKVHNIIVIRKEYLLYLDKLI